VLERQVLLATGRAALPVFRGQRIPDNSRICYQPRCLSSQRCCPSASGKQRRTAVGELHVGAALLLIGEPLGLRELTAVALTLGGVMLALTGTRRRA
jgi:hypothetical protein